MTIRIPYSSLKVVFFIHLILVVWATQTGWLPFTYFAYNSLLLLTILWTIHSRDSEEGPFMGICTNVVSVLLDIFTLCIFWPLEVTGPLSRFSNFCSICNLIMRPVSSFLMYKILIERAATYGNYTLPSGLDNILSSANLNSSRRPYEDLDQPAPTQTLGSHTPDNLMGSPVNQPQ